MFLCFLKISSKQRKPIYKYQPNSIYIPFLLCILVFLNKQTNWPSFLPLQSLGLNFEGCSLLRSSQRHHGHCNTVDVWLLCTEPHVHEFFLSTQNRKLVLIVAPVFQSRGVKYPYVCVYCVCGMVFCLSLFILSAIIVLIVLCMFLSGYQERCQGSIEDKAPLLYDTISLCFPCKVCVLYFPKDK